jgi:hypothetical protein
MNYCSLQAIAIASCGFMGPEVRSEKKTYTATASLSRPLREDLPPNSPSASERDVPMSACACFLQIAHREPVTGSDETDQQDHGEKCAGDSRGLARAERFPEPDGADEH